MAKKTETAKKVKKISKTRQEVVDAIIEEMEKGSTPWDGGWTKVRPINALTQKPYTGINKVKLMIEGKNTNDDRYVTYKQAQLLGAEIKPKAKPIGLECKQLYDILLKKDFDIRDITSLPAVEQNEYIKKFVRTYTTRFNVFNGKDVKGLPKIKTQSFKDKIKKAKDLIDKSEAPIKNEKQDRAFYNPFTDTITLPLKKQFKSEEEYIATALHEMGHSTGNPKRLNRNITGKFGSPQYAKEELVAELTSAMLAPELGVQYDEKSNKNHATYLKGWLKATKVDPSYMTKAISEANLASDYILTYDKYGRLKNRLQENLKRQQEIINRKRGRKAKNKKET